MSDVNIGAKLSVDTGNTQPQIKGVKNEILDSKKALEGFNDTNEKSVSSNQKMGSSLNETSGKFGALKQRLTETTPGVMGVNQAFNVLRANPIIAVVTIVVGLFVAVIAKLKDTEKVGDSLGKAFGTLSGIVSAFTDKVLTPLIDAFVWLVDLFTSSVVGILDTLGLASKENADRVGVLTDALDDLNDTEKDNAIALAESNRKLQEAREIAGDSTVAIKDRVAALKEAGKIEKQELENVSKFNREKASIQMELYARELNARTELIDKIKEGTVESLKAARAELALLPNVNKEKLYAIDQQIIAAEDAGAKSAKISKKTESAITSLEKEEKSKREAAAKEAAAKAKERKDKENNERIEQEKKFQDELKKIITDGQKAIDDALKILRVANRETELKEVEIKFKNDMAVAEKSGFSTLRIREAYRHQQDELNQKYDSAEAEAENTKRNNEQLSLEAHQMAMFNKLTSATIQTYKLQEEAAKHKIDLDKVLLEQQKAMQAETADIIGKASEVFGKQTVVGKGLAIAQALINTYSGATDALRAKSALPSPFDFVAKAINVGAVIATGLKAVKAITAVNVPGGGGGSGTTASSLTATAPAPPVQTSTSLDQKSINQIGNAANKLFIVEKDITSKQEQIKQLNRAARV